MPRFAACGPVFRRGPLSLLRRVFLPCPVRLPARGVWLPGQTDVLSRLRSTSSLAIVFGTSSFFVYMFHRVARYRGGRMCFPAVLTSVSGGLPWEGHRVYCVLGSRSHLVFNFAFSGGGSSGFDVVSHFGCCRFPAGRTIDERLMTHQHTD